MKHLLSITILAVALLITPTATLAELQLSNLGVRVIKTEYDQTFYSWKVRVRSSETKNFCTVRISFRDKDGFEIHYSIKSFSVKYGSKIITDTDICDTKIWKQIHKYIAEGECP